MFQLNSFLVWSCKLEEVTVKSGFFIFRSYKMMKFPYPLSELHQHNYWQLFFCIVFLGVYQIHPAADSATYLVITLILTICSLICNGLIVNLIVMVIYNCRNDGWKKVNHSCHLVPIIGISPFGRNAARMILWKRNSEWRFHLATAWYAPVFLIFGSHERYEVMSGFES